MKKSVTFVHDCEKNANNAHVSRAEKGEVYEFFGDHKAKTIDAGV